MLKTICLCFGSLLFDIILFVVYKYKTKVTKYENKYFSGMLVLLMGVLLTEMASVYTIVHQDTISVINEIVCRCHGILVLAWAVTMGGYLFSYVDNNSTEKRQESKKRIIIFVILFTLSAVTSIFLPYKYVKVGDSGYLDGVALYFLYFVGITVVTIAFILLLVNRKKLKQYKTFPIVVAIIETLIAVPLSIIFPTVYIITTSFTFDVYLIYFTLENPDLFLINELDKAKKAFEASSKAKTDFLSNMSHEIRTPMNAIIGFSESLLKDSGFDASVAQKDIEHIYGAGGTLLEIINNILDISKIESGEDTLDEKEYNLASIILELHSIIDARVAGSKVKFVTNVDESLPCKIYGDKTKLFQVLLNILSNAVKYTEVGRIELLVKGTVSKDILSLHFRVSDTGMGIKKEDYNKLFEKFSRLEGATQNEIEGTGLGLAITKKLVTTMNGNVWFESKYGAGTDFYVELDQKIVDANPMGDIFKSEARSQLSENNYFDCSAYKVLLVDDNELNLKVAKKLLSPYKFQITTLNSGKDCVDLIKCGEVYDLIFLDHMMPGMDGIEVLHILKSLKDYKVPPIVALTANAITGMREMYLQEGFDEYLSKPVNNVELNKILEKYFKNKN